MSKKKLAVMFSTAALVAGLAGAIVVAEPGFVNVTSTAVKEVEPNRAEVSFYIETTDKSSSAAAEKNKKIANEVISKIKPQLSKEAKDTIKTSSFVVSPNYVWTKDNKRNITGYTATNSVQVVTSNIANAGNLIDIAVKAGATRVDSFNLSLDNTEKYCNDVIIEAVKESRTKADSIAHALGTSVLGVKSVTTSCSTRTNNNGLVRYAAAKFDNALSSAGAEEETSTPIEASKIKLNATVNASFNLRQEY